jgi:hypothetical protein
MPVPVGMWLQLIVEGGRQAGGGVLSQHGASADYICCS